MQMQRIIGRVIAITLILTSVTLIGAARSYAGDGESACSAIENNLSFSAFEELGCCACNDSGSCIKVQHDGVASCTFEFCSDTDCEYIESE
jgi:hypothetical protein